jgi:hypothetical protein
MDRTRNPQMAEEARPEQAHSPGELTAHETQQVLARAAQLERDRRQTRQEPALDLRELERIGEEAGLSREAIRRAFLELRSGALDAKEAPGLAERLIGATSVEARRLLPDAPSEAKARLHALLRRELLQPEERQGEKTTWSPAAGLWAAIQRGLNWQGQSAWQRGQVVSEVMPAPPGVDAGSQVRLEARPGASPKQYLAIAGVSGSVYLLGMSIPVVLDPHAPWTYSLLGAGLGVLTSGVVTLVARYKHRRRLANLRRAIERVLDELSGEA